MMIDEVVLSGLSACLRRADGSVALGPGEQGVTGAVSKGESVEVNAVDLYLEMDSALDLFQREDTPLLTLELSKEVFPTVFFDPHSHRVHQIAGFEDFKRADKMAGMVPMEVDGVPTLVSIGSKSKCGWLSARYVLPKPIKLDLIAWTLAISRTTPPDVASYKVSLRYWPPSNPQVISGPGALVPLTFAWHRPADARHQTFAQDIEIGAYQIDFRAEVQFDTAIVEQHGSAPDRSMGTPLLQAVFLVERVEPAYAIHSLQELVSQSSAYQLLDPVSPIRRVTARVHFPAVLTEGEALTIAVHSPKIKRCEARLDATLRQRPVEPIARNA